MHTTGIRLVAIHVAYLCSLELDTSAIAAEESHTGTVESPLGHLLQIIWAVTHLDGENHEMLVGR